VQHEIVVAARDGQRVELDRPEAAKDFQNRIGASLERARRCEQLARDEKAPRGVCGDFQDDCFARISALWVRFFAW
jgi:hypothetical protein